MSHSASMIASEMVELAVTFDGGRRSVHPLVEGKVLMVGTAAHHGLCLQADGVAQTHCMMTLRDGQVYVRDWNSATGTFLNDRRLEDEGVLQRGDSLRIGKCSIEITGAGTQARKQENSIPSEWAIAEEVSAEEDLGSKLLKLIESSTELVLAEETTSSAQETVDDVSDVLGMLKQAEAPSATSLDDWFAAIPAAGDDAGEMSDSDDLAFLKQELADRDARIRELEALVAEGDHFGLAQDESEQGQQVESMSTRLQQVLDELEKSDERINLLTDLLSRSEEAGRAAEEERSQIENWIGEIEQLFSARESEWHAQREALQKRIEGITSQRDELERKLVSGGAFRNQAGSPQGLDQLQQMQGEIQRLRRALEHITEERNELRSRAETERGEDLQQKLKTEVDAALREERLKMAEERSQLTRLRQELAAVQQDKKSEEGTPPGDAREVDYKIRAFREHLREIHETDPKPVSQRDSVSYRLGRIWRKLNGTPLDTD